MSTLGCGHEEDGSKRRSFSRPGSRESKYNHHECVEGHIEHSSSDRVIVPRESGPRVVRRIEDFCPVCHP